MFLNKIRSTFCVRDTTFVSATNVARAGKRGNICVGNNVSSFASTFSLDVVLAMQIREIDILTYLQQTSLRQVRRTTSRISPNRQQYKNGFNDELVNTIVEARDLARKSLIE